jgi:hypothetical protein
MQSGFTLNLIPPQPFINASGRDAYGACDGARRLARFPALHNKRSTVIS